MSLALASIDFESGDVKCCQTELCDSMASIKSLGIFNFSHFSTSVRHLNTPPELANEIVHRGGTFSKHVSYLYRKKFDCFWLFFEMMKAHYSVVTSAVA